MAEDKALLVRVEGREMTVNLMNEMPQRYVCYIKGMEDQQVTNAEFRRMTVLATSPQAAISYAAGVWGVDESNVNAEVT